MILFTINFLVSIHYENSEDVFNSLYTLHSPDSVRKFGSCYRIDYYQLRYESSIVGNNVDAGWSVNKVHNSIGQLEGDPDETYEENVAFYRNWLKERNNWLLTQWGLVK